MKKQHLRNQMGKISACKRNHLFIGRFCAISTDWAVHWVEACLFTLATVAPVGTTDALFSAFFGLVNGIHRQTQNQNQQTNHNGIFHITLPAGLLP